MRTRNAGGAATEPRTPVGTATDRGLAVRVLAERADPEPIAVAAVMGDDVRTIDRDAGFEKRGERGVRRLPVVSGDGLVGAVSLDDPSERPEAERRHLTEATKQG